MAVTEKFYDVGNGAERTAPIPHKKRGILYVIFLDTMADAPHADFGWRLSLDLRTIQIIIRRN